MNTFAKVFLLTLSLAYPVHAETQSWLTSFYKDGKITANGEPFYPNGYTCAHKTLPFNTVLLLTYNDKHAVCRVNDRGPFIKGRDLDVTLQIAKELDFVKTGTAKIQVIILR